MRFRFMVALAATACTAALLAPAPASAIDSLNHLTGTSGPISMVMPTSGSVEFNPNYNTFSCDSNLSQSMLWETARRMTNIRDVSNETRAYEHEAMIFGEGAGHYDDTTVQNLPNYYQDTAFDDDPGAPYSFAGGSWKSRDLSPDVWYNYQLRLNRWTPAGCLTSMITPTRYWPNGAA